MPYQRYAVVQHKLELWSQALAENIEEVLTSGSLWPSSWRCWPC